MPQKIEKIAVIGLGTLGTQIAIQAAYYGCSVRGYDQDPEIFPKTIQKIKGMMKFLGKGPTMRVEEWEKAAAKVKLANDLAEAVKDADLVIEAVPEKPRIEAKSLGPNRFPGSRKMPFWPRTAPPSLSPELKAPPSARRNVLTFIFTSRRSAGIL